MIKNGVDGYFCDICGDILGGQWPMIQIDYEKYVFVSESTTFPKLVHVSCFNENN